MLKLLSQIVPKAHKQEGSEQIRQPLHTPDLQVRHPERERGDRKIHGSLIPPNKIRLLMFKMSAFVPLVNIPVMCFNKAD